MVGVVVVASVAYSAQLYILAVLQPLFEVEVVCSWLALLSNGESGVKE